MKTPFPLLIAALAALTLALFAISTHSPANATTPDRHGDATCDGEILVNDAIAIVSESAGISPGVACPDRSDVGCDGEIDPVDAVRVLRWFVGSPLARLITCPEVGATLT